MPTDPTDDRRSTRRPFRRPSLVASLVLGAALAACGGSTSSPTTTALNPPDLTTPAAPPPENAPAAIELTPDGALIAGTFSGSITLGDHTASSAGGTDIYVAAIDRQGTWRWVRSAGGPGNDAAADLAVGADGSVLITGHFQQTAEFGTQTTTSNGGSDIYIARLTADGTWSDVATAGGPGYDCGRALTIDADGNAHVTGLFWNTASFDTTTITAAGQGDIFVAELTGDGSWNSALQAGGTENDDVHAIATLPDGTLAISGHFRGDATFGEHTVRSLGDYDIVVAALDDSDTWTWAQSAGGRFYDRGKGLTVGPGGELLLTGFAYGDTTFGDEQITGVGDGDIFTAALDRQGRWLWAAGAGTFDYDEGFAVVSGQDSAVIVTGAISGGEAMFGDIRTTGVGIDDVIVAAYSPDTRQWRWVLRGGGPYRDETYAAAIDSDGSIYVTGVFTRVADFNGTQLTAQGPGPQTFVAKISADGSWEWAG